MRQQFRIVCRGSTLSIAQADIVKNRLRDLDPEVAVELVIKETRGDINQAIPLQEMEGKDFFTKDIQDYLVSGKADFAVHSLKDVSGENFFNGNHYAIIERDDPRDAAIFNEDILDKLSHQDKIRLGTSSPRRVEMATGFLLRALPRRNQQEVIIEALPIRGNVDTRLQKLAAGEFDGVVLACAGLNRLLRADRGKQIANLLKGKRLMILPLLTCPPAPGQGAIVVETTPGNQRAVNVLQALNNVPLAKAVDQERKIAHRYGSGCHQKFGVIHIHAGDRSFIYAAGKDRKDQEFAASYSEEGLRLEDIRKSAAIDPKDPFFAEHDVIMINESSPPSDSKQKVWVSETETWFTLANQGVWVEGSLEGFGLKFIEVTLKSPLVNLASTYAPIAIGASADKSTYAKASADKSTPSNELSN